MGKKHVLIVDDSAIVRDILGRELSRFSDIEVVGTAIDPFIAREKLSRMHVDIILLDIEMPRMDGLTFLKYLMKSYPIPVIILSSLVDGSNSASLEALDLGAIEVVAKPDGPYSVSGVIARIVEIIRSIDIINFDRIRSYSDAKQRSTTAAPIKNTAVLSRIQTTHKLIVVGASTGGTHALETLFSAYDKILPPTVAVIHMPEKFTASFAKRLNETCSSTVKEAENGETALPGYVYIAPGNYHLTVKRSGAEYKLHINSAPRLHGQRPAVDHLFNSAAECAGKNSIGILLTGMGKDGAAGLLNLHNSGAFTICQDEKTSVVFGMPKEAIDLGAADIILPLEEIYPKLLDRS